MRVDRVIDLRCAEARRRAFIVITRVLHCAQASRETITAIAQILRRAITEI